MIDKYNDITSKQRIIALDILRIICALFIFIRHAHNSGGFSFGSKLNLLANDTTSMIMTLFFVLSGLSLALSNKSQNFSLSSLRKKVCKFARKYPSMVKLKQP